jgi:hypothetical protein
MLIQVGDWVQTETRHVGKVAWIDADRRQVTITTVDPQEMRMVDETYRIDQVVKFEVER